MPITLTPPTADQCRAAERHLAQARLSAAQGQEWPRLPLPLELRRVGVVGAGTMGTDIARCAIGAGLEVVLLDAQPDALDRARQRIARSLDNAAQRGAFTPAEAGSLLSALRPTGEWRELAEVDLVIEAVYEDTSVKCEVMTRLDALCAPRTVFVSNTSTLDVDTLAAATRRPQQVLGMHFLTPAHVTPLVEVVRGQLTSAAALVQARALAQRLGKLPVLTTNAWGFIGNRMFEAYLREVDALQLQGVPAARIDAALQAFGFALGPCRTLDMAGTDLVSQVLAERGKRFQQPPAYRRITRRLAEMGRFGHKTGRGHYLYDAGRAQPDPDLERVCREEAQSLGIGWSPAMSDEDIVRRCVTPLIEEGQAVLRERIACRASDIDLVWVLGYGFPAQRGGPMWMRETAD
jgi:3-hydroxyacyl-CoA dehydrogenase